MDARKRRALALASIALLGTVGTVGAVGRVGAVGGMGDVAMRGGPSVAHQPAGPAEQYLVFYAAGGREAALRAVGAAGGWVEGREDRLGYLLVRTGSPERIGADPAVVGVTPDRRIGAVAAAPTGSPDFASAAGFARSGRDAAGPATGTRAGTGTETGTRTGTKTGSRTGARHTAGTPVADPLSGRQWDMKMIGATATGSYAKATGSHKVLVGIIDTGVDGSHPDIAANFNRALSRNFVTDRPRDPNGRPLDGPCEYRGCKDPADVDGDGHGTHVASTIGSPLNGIGVAGVAPNVSLVNLRAGTDSGLFFLKPTMDALTYAADVGVDVVNMSFYVDPWAFNCPNNPQDSARERLEQRGILEGMRRAVGYARRHGVTLVTAIGNGGGDLGRPTKDSTSPDYPVGAERSRKIDNSCLNVPAELDGVISVAAVGPSGRKAGYSDYGVEQTDIAAPGGDTFDAGTSLRGARREVLAAAPARILQARGLLDRSGRPTDSSVVRDCHGGQCAYYQYMEGTSMAAPHVTGIAAIIIGRFGRPGKGGLFLDPARVERLLYASAVHRPCPSPRAFRYGRGDTQVCEGGSARNGFFGHGIANAERAATLGRKPHR